jgi:hypothetical protein
MRHPVQPSTEQLSALYTEARRAWVALGYELQLSVDCPTSIRSSYVLWWTANRCYRSKRIEWYGGTIALGSDPLPSDLMRHYLKTVINRALGAAAITARLRYQLR